MPYKILSNCIGCGDCANLCVNGAITLNQNDDPQIDPNKCLTCPSHLHCVPAIDCSVGALEYYDVEAPKYKIDETACVNCGTCIGECPVKAITQSGDTCEININKCVGCGNCVGMCPNSAIVSVN